VKVLDPVIANDPVCEFMTNDPVDTAVTTVDPFDVIDPDVMILPFKVNDPVTLTDPVTFNEPDSVGILFPCY